MSDKKRFQKGRVYNAVIIGAGKIAALFDTPQSKKILTHAHAYTRHPLTKLVGIYDINFSKAQKAARKWCSHPFQHIDTMFKHVKPEIVSICTPDDQHYQILKKVVKYRPKIVICEKPLTTDVKDTKKVIKLYALNKIPVLINYSRRFDSTVQNIKKALAKGEYGQVIGASAIYTKGLLHNGSHVIDLARYFFGEITSARKLYSLDDYSEQDRSVGAFLSFVLCPQFYLMPADQRRYTIFEFEILCDKARLRFVDEGFWLLQQETAADPVYAGYTILGKTKAVRTTLDRALFQLIDNAVGHLQSGDRLLCNLDDAWRVQAVCQSLSKK